MFKPWPKIPRLSNEVFHITEKIDGTNGCIIISSEYSDIAPLHFDFINHNGFGIWAQNKNRLITPDDDNYGFAKWVQDNASILMRELGPGYHYGEWWGKGISRGYGLEERRFSLFNTTKRCSICYNVPSLISVSCGVYLDGHISNSLVELEEAGSLAAPGYMYPEGVVIYTEKAKCSWKVIIENNEKECQMPTVAIP